MYGNNIFKRDISVLENKNQGKGFLNKWSETLTTAGFLFILFFLIRCTAYEKELNDNYSISAFDSVDEIALAYTDENNICITIINPKVIKVGQNEDYIIVEQEQFRSKNKFYIIPLKNKISNSVEKNIFGNLSETEFKNKKKKLGIEQLDFSIFPK